jgi:CheY-like chemotaxis protein
MPFATQNRRILILDDDVAIASTLETIFRQCGYEVRTAHSAEEAIETISTWTPDLALVDVMLPQMNGIEFGIVLQSNYPACRVVLVSGHPAAGDLLDTARQHGHVFEILAKPLHPLVILKTVSNLLPERPSEPDGNACEGVRDFCVDASDAGLVS